GAELGERLRPDAAVAELEVGVARVAGDRAPVTRIAHAVDHRAVAAGGLAETAAMLAGAVRAQCPVDERGQTPGPVVGVRAGRAGVDVLLAAEGREAVWEHHDAGRHAPLLDPPREALGQVLLKVLPVGVRPARARI